MDAPMMEPMPGAPAMPADPEAKVISRETPIVDPQRAALVKRWIEEVEADKKHWEPEFKKMRDAAAFAAGLQWPGQAKGVESDQYIANITLRHINQRVASVYAKNPRVRATRKPKLWSTVWDGTREQLQAAQQSLQAVQSMQQDPMMAAQAVAAGAMQAPSMDPEQAQAIIADAQQVQQQKALYDRMGKTLEIVAQHGMDEQNPKFKIQAKQLVRRVLTCKVGYIKVGYQRIMQYGADIDSRIKDATDKLQEIERLAADAADGEMEVESADRERLRLLIADLQKKKELVLREGMVYGFPKSWSIIPSRHTVQLKGFIGAPHIAEEFLFTPDQVKKIYNVDVSKCYTPHNAMGVRGEAGKNAFCAVYEIYDIEGQQCMTVCAGYPDFLKEPGEPDVETEHFHPYRVLTFNDVESDEQVYPPSDVELIKPMQLDYNRARDGLRVHRQANRPAHIASKSMFDTELVTSLGEHDDHEIIYSNAKPEDLTRGIVAKPVNPISPELYNVDHCYMDVQRVQGDQAANLGGTSDATATEASIAENSRVTTLQSNIDDLDDFLTDVMRDTGYVLLLNMRKDAVMRIAGPGAVWPETTRQDAAEELILEIKAGSSGRPNKAARLQAIEKTAPFLLQVPGVKPKKLVDFMFQEIDENIDPEDFYEDGLPSIVAMNNMAKPNLAPGPGSAAQGAQGAQNADQPVSTPAKAQNMYPAPDARGPGTALQ